MNAKAPMPVTTLGKLILLAETGKADAATLNCLARVAEQEKADIRRSAWHDSMRACQAEMSPVSKDAKNDQTRSKYVTLAALDEALRPIYIKHGFSVMFDTRTGREEEVAVELKITHEAGHTEVYCIDMPADGKGIKGTTMMTRTHAAASAVSYGRRYLLTMAFNIATSDDDGNAAGVRHNAPVSKPRAPKVTVEEAEMLTSIADKVGADRRKLCDYLSKAWNMDIETMFDVPSDRYDDVKEVLARKLKDNTQKAGVNAD